ncbi:hypothetical protein FS837_002976 [Tulasnella sp. UAMH 9824]|nr:hypothetical protein FS837_002976 [Tulasnella sp. UAMH 9824]
MSDTENDPGHDAKRRRLGDSTATHSQRYEPGVGSSTAMSLANLLSPPQAAHPPRESLTQSPERNEALYIPDSMDEWLQREAQMQVESGSSAIPMRVDAAQILTQEPSSDPADEPHPGAQPASLETWLAEEEAAEAARGKGKGKAKAVPEDEVFGLEKPARSDSLPHLSQLQMESRPADPPPPPAEPTPPTRPRSPTPPPASEYNCPICFCPPTAAVLTPCGHIMCGSCLFSAIETATQRARMNGYGGEALEARCPVCRAKLERWDGRGGGVIGLEMKVALSVQ